MLMAPYSTAPIDPFPTMVKLKAWGAERLAEANVLDPRLARRDTDSALGDRRTDQENVKSIFVRLDLRTKSFPRFAKTM